MKESPQTAKKTSDRLVSAGSMTVGASMHLGLFCCAVAATILLTGCNEEQASDGGLSTTSGGRTLSVIGSIRPKADPSLVAKIKQEEQMQRQQQMAAANASGDQRGPNGEIPLPSDPAQRNLPAVDNSPISGLANMLGFNQNQSQQQPQPQQQPQNALALIPSAPLMQSAPPPPPVASYGGYQTAGAGSLIPPPPAVSLTTQAQAYAPPGGDPYAYANPYQNPYMNAYVPPVQAQSQPAHPAGSMFSNGGGNGGSSNSSANDEAAKKRMNMAVITPTGMDARSPYKQRDELKILVRAALANAPIKELRDEKVAQLLGKTEVGLPADSSKGNLSLTQRQIDTLFKNPGLDKKVVPQVKKVETDVAQAYYRYIYAFNKFSLTQQQVAARKQEIDMADTGAEKQRAAADLASAQNDADASKDDLRAAQQDLASISGAQAARAVIQRVSGVAPSMEQLAVADASCDDPVKKDEGMLGTVASAFKVFDVFGHKGGATADSAKPAPAVAKADAGKKVKGKKAAGSSTQTASAAVHESSSESPASSAPAASVPSGPIAFQLKTVQTTPRKSVLKVSLKNNSGDNVNIDDDAVSVLEGDHRLAEAAVRAEWDSASVGPNQEVTGTITIFGRPWNDKLTVCLSEGGKTFQLRR